MERVQTENLKLKHGFHLIYPKNNLNRDPLLGASLSFCFSLMPQNIARPTR